MFVYVFEPFHPPHVNRGDWHSGSNPDASDCSSDVKVMKTGGSPYQQPTSYLGGDRATVIFLLSFCLARHNIEIRDVPLYLIYIFLTLFKMPLTPPPKGNRCTHGYVHEQAHYWQRCPLDWEPLCSALILDNIRHRSEETMSNIPQNLNNSTLYPLP